MKKEMTITELKKKLAGVERKELEQILCGLYKSFDDAAQSINLQLLDSSYGLKLLKLYQDKMYKIFFPKDIIRSGFSLSAAKKVISDFKKVCQNEELVLDLKLYFVGCGTEFTNTYGDIDERFYQSLCDAFFDVANAASGDQELFEEWEDRLRRIVVDSEEIGWGFHDFIVEEYYNIPWVDEDEDY